MTPQRKTTSHAGPAATVQKSSRRWLLFVHQLPSTPSNLRVKTWRRLQQFGAIPRKQSVYVLPDTPSTREDLEWLTTEVKAAGGDAEVFVGGPADSWSDDTLVEEFRRSRQEAYAALAKDIGRALQRVGGKRPSRGGRAPSVNRILEGFRQRLAAIERIDFFGSAGRDRVAQLVGEFEKRVSDRADRRRQAPRHHRESRELPGPAVGHTPTSRCGSHGLRLAHSALHRSAGTIWFCRRSTRSAEGLRSL